MWLIQGKAMTMTLTLDAGDPRECAQALTSALVLHQVVKVASGVFELVTHQYVDGAAVPQRLRIIVESVK
jgi:hypothetical protein